MPESMTGSEIGGAEIGMIVGSGSSPSTVWLANHFGPLVVGREARDSLHRGGLSVGLGAHAIGLAGVAKCARPSEFETGRGASRPTD